MARAGAKAAVDVVIDDADVLHERVDARRSDEAVALRLELLGECLGLRGGLRDVGEGWWRRRRSGLVGRRQLREARRGRDHRASVVDRGLDLAAVADDRRVLDQAIDVRAGHRRDPGRVEPAKRRAETLAPAEHDGPAEADLEHAQRQRLEQPGLVERARAPDLVVVARERGIRRARPGAAWLPVGPDDHVAAHREFISCSRFLTASRAQWQTTRVLSRSGCSSSIAATMSSTVSSVSTTREKSRRYCCDSPIDPGSFGAPTRWWPDTTMCGSSAA